MPCLSYSAPSFHHSFSYSFYLLSSTSKGGDSYNTFIFHFFFQICSLPLLLRYLFHSLTPPFYLPCFFTLRMQHFTTPVHIYFIASYAYNTVHFTILKFLHSLLTTSKGGNSHNNSLTCSNASLARQGCVSMAVQLAYTSYLFTTILLGISH